MSTVVLIDLSSILHPIWHMSQNEPDPNHASIATVAKVRALASGQPHVAVCCDSGRSFRADIDPLYKANRGERDATLIHQLTLAQERLREDGFPVWAQAGMEADDLIATAATIATARGMNVLVVSADKDLLQLVGPTVQVKSLASGTTYDEAGVEAKLGVKPGQVRDWLTLVGDTADNVKGADKIGAKTAAVLLWTHGTLEGIYEEAAKEPCAMKPSVVASLREFSSRKDTVRALISLRYDCDIPFEEILKDRVPAEAATFGVEEEEMETTTEEKVLTDGTVVAETVQTQTAQAPAPTPEKALLEDVLAATPAEWERQLDPRTMRDARLLAKDMFDSRMFAGYGSPQAVLSTIMVGRELGLPAMASLRLIHNVEGRHSLSAQIMVALVLKSGLCEFFDPVSFSATEATYETKRKGARNPVKLTHTIEMAQTANNGAFKPKSNWLTVPTDMLVSRASSRLARMVYPDLLAGLYTPEELADIRENGNA